MTYAAETPGVMTSQLSIAPSYAGSITAVTIVFAIIANICSLNFIGFVVQQVLNFTLSHWGFKGTPAEWNFAITVIAVGNILGGIFFILFSSG